MLHFPRNFSRLLHFAVSIYTCKRRGKQYFYVNMTSFPAPLPARFDCDIYNT